MAAGIGAGRSLQEIQKTLTLDAYKGFERWDTHRTVHIAQVYELDHGDAAYRRNADELNTLGLRASDSHPQPAQACRSETQLRIRASPEPEARSHRSPVRAEPLTAMVIVHMKRNVAAVAVVVSFVLGVAVRAQLANPIPAPITKQGLRVEIKDVARLPDSRGLRPANEDVAPTSWARVNFVRELPDGRRFANDMRGLLYVLDRNGQPSLYANVAAVFPLGWYRGLQNGLVNFEFHPEFAANGLFYTIHNERGPGNPGKPDFIPPGFTAGRGHVSRPS